MDGPFSCRSVEELIAAGNEFISLDDSEVRGVSEARPWSPEWMDLALSRGPVSSDDRLLMKYFVRSRRLAYCKQNAALK